MTTLDEEAGEVTHRWPQILPDGRAVIFTSHTQTNNFDDAAVEILVLETGERRVLHQGGSYGRYVPSGHLVYASEGTLFAMPFDLETLTVSGSAAPVIEGVSTDSTQGGAQFSVSREGTLVYAVGSGSATQYAAVWVDREGQATPFWEGRQDYRNPRLSPDGTRLAVDILTGDNRDVWVYDLEQDIATRLTFDAAADSAPVWSPDSEFILFSSARDGVDNLYRKAADGSSEVERLAESERVQEPSSVSPDGKLLAYDELSPGASWDIWLLPLEADAEPRPFLATPFVEVGPVFSPDGHWIAYFSNESGFWEVYVRPASGAQGKWQVSSRGGAWPLWSSDGKELLYRDLSQGINSVAVETAGDAFRPGRPRQLFQGPFVGVAGNNYYDIAPDGERFVMFQTEQEASFGGDENLRVVLNWFGELERIFAGASSP